MIIFRILLWRAMGSILTSKHEFHTTDLSIRASTKSTHKIMSRSHPHSKLIHIIVDEKKKGCVMHHPANTASVTNQRPNCTWPTGATWARLHATSATSPINFLLQSSVWGLFTVHDNFCHAGTAELLSVQNVCELRSTQRREAERDSNIRTERLTRLVKIQTENSQAKKKTEPKENSWEICSDKTHRITNQTGIHLLTCLTT